METPQLLHLLNGWPIAPPMALTPLTGGTNNRTWAVKTEDGLSYVLRLTSGTADLSHFRHEVALLTALGTKALPFRLPLPLQAHNEDALVLFEENSQKPAIATLTPFLPGSIPERSVPHIARVAVALAQLDAALATIPASSLPDNSETARFMYGDLCNCSPFISNPLAAIEQVLQPVQARPIGSLLTQSLKDWEDMSAQELPQQILHRDCGPGNVLMDNEQVTAILDFEFADVDRRVFDLCVAMSWWPVRLMGTGKEWELIDTLGRIYTAHFPLTEEELLILPTALRMRDTTSLVYRIGRYLAGLETEQTIQERAQHSLWREAWLMANRETLLQHAIAWQEKSVQ